MASESQVAVVDVGKWFVRVLLLIALLTFVCLGLWIGMAIAIPKPSQSQTNAIENLSKAFTGCLGALIGMVGGKYSSS